MSSITSVIVSVNYLKVKKEKKGECCFVSFFSFIVFEGEKNVLTVIATVEGEMRVFQGNFCEKSLNFIIKNLKNNIICKHTSHR